MIILIILSILIGFIFWYRCRSMSNPATLFSFLWAAIFFMYEIRLLNYYDLETEILIIYYIQMIAMAIGSEFANRVDIKFSLKQKSKTEYSVNFSVLFVLCAITIAVLLMNSISIIENILAGKSFYDIADEGDIIIENDSVGVMVGVSVLIVKPVTAMISPIAASEIISTNGKNKLILFLINIAIVLLHTFQHGGRDMLILFAISYIFAYLMQNKLLIKKWLKIGMFFLAVATLWFVIWVSSSRGIEDIYSSLYYYFSGVVPHLQTCISRLSVDDLTLGAGFTYGIMLPVLIGLKAFNFIDAYPEIYSQVGANFNIPKQINYIGNGVSINAHVGTSYYFYTEGGIFFVILGWLIFGYILMNLYIKTKKECSNKNIAIYLVMMYVLITSFIRFQLIEYMYALALMYIVIFIYKKKGMSE